jgi:DNA-binding transcriptional LysR family regulator
VAVAIAEQGSITRAAGSLHQSSSAISHTLLGLETELGVDLFHRLPHGMALTDAGELFVAAARRALHEAEVARTSVDSIRGLVRGQVNVASALGLTTPLAGLIGSFARLHPQVVVRVFPSVSPEGVVDLVRNAACDVGFTWGATVPEDLHTEPVYADEIVAVVPEGHRLARRESIPIAELDGERIVAPLMSSTMRPIFDSLFEHQGFRPTVVAEAATTDVVLELVRAGVGCTVMFASSAASVVGRGASALEIAGQTSIAVTLVTCAQQERTPAARAFGELAMEHFAS